MTNFRKSFIAAAVMMLAVTSASVSFGQVRDGGPRIRGIVPRVVSKSRALRPPAVVNSRAAPTERSVAIEPAPAAPAVPQVTGTPRVIRSYSVEPVTPTYTRPRAKKLPAYMYPKTDSRRYTP